MNTTSQRSVIQQAQNNVNFDNPISVSSKVGNTWSASSKFFTVAQFNPRSVGQLEKCSNMNDFILDHKVDFFLSLFLYR